MRLELRQSAFFIGAHQPTVARNIGRENGAQSPFYTFGSHCKPFAQQMKKRLGQAVIVVYRMGQRQVADHRKCTTGIMALHQDMF